MARYLAWRALALCALVLGVAQPVLAHAPPLVLQIKWQPDGDKVVLVTNRGLIFGDSKGQDWRLMCNLALDLSTADKPHVAYVPGGRLLVAAATGLRVTTDGGCTWDGVATYGMQQIPALAQHPVDPATLLIATFGGGQGGLQKSSDGGRTFSPVSALPDNNFVQEIVYAPSAPDTLYLSGQTFDDQGSVMHYIARSDDGGATLEQQQVTLLDTEIDDRLLAVSPKNPNVLIAKTDVGNPTVDMERILLSVDGGKTLSSPLQAMQIFSGTFSEDGSTLWVAGIDGLWRSTDQGKTFEQLPGPMRMTDVTARDSVLWVGGWYQAGANGLATSMTNGDGFERVMAFTDVKKSIDCDAQSSTTMNCQMLWSDWQREQFGVVDAGMPIRDAAVTPDAGAPDAAVPSKAKGSGCSCGVVRRSEPAPLMAAPLAMLLLWRLRSRRARTNGRPLSMFNQRSAGRFARPCRPRRSRVRASAAPRRRCWHYPANRVETRLG